MRSLLSKRKVLLNILTIFVFIFITNIFMVDFKAISTLEADANDKYSKYLPSLLQKALCGEATYEEYGHSFTDDDYDTVYQAYRYSYTNNLNHYYGNSNFTSQTLALKSAKNSFISQLDTSGKTQAEICKLVHDKLISSVTYELSDDQYSMVFSAYGALVDHRAVCEGIAAAYDIIMDYYGIESLIITGEAVGTDNPSNLVNHAWNMVKLDGDWYEIDCTWDLGSSDFTRGTLSYDYFLKTTSYMTSKNHKRTGLGTYLPTANGTKYAYTGESYNKNDPENTYGYPGMTDEEIPYYYYFPYGETRVSTHINRKGESYDITYKSGKHMTCEIVSVSNASIIEITDEGYNGFTVTSINKDAFKKCTSAKEITIPIFGISKLPNKLLYKCKKLKKLNLYVGKYKVGIKKIPKNLVTNKVKKNLKFYVMSSTKKKYKTVKKIIQKSGFKNNKCEYWKY